MIALADFGFVVVSAFLGLLELIVLAAVILSWLVAFQVINMRNPTAYRLVVAIDRASGVLLRPIRRIVPDLGGLDISPIIFLVPVDAARTYLLRPFFVWLASLGGGSAI